MGKLEELSTRHGYLSFTQSLVGLCAHDRTLCRCKDYLEAGDVVIGEEDEDETLVLWDEPREVVSITTEDEYGWQEVVVSGWNPTAPPSKIKAHPAKRFLVAR